VGWVKGDISLDFAASFVFLEKNRERRVMRAVLVYIYF
jgi:hypothetical protein